MPHETDSSSSLIFLTAGTGKTGRRVAHRLQARGVPTRIGSRSSPLPFDWTDPTTWGPALDGVSAVYVVYYPDLAAPGAADTVQSFVDRAVEQDVERLVLLSGRGEEEAQRCEEIVQAAGVDWTVLRATWFNQNFSEGFMRDLVRDGMVALPASNVPEPFVDADDIADVAAAALTEPGHAGQLYELTGPRLLTFAEAIGAIADAIGREVTYAPISQETFVAGLRENGLPGPMVDLLDYLFAEVMDGRNSVLADGVQRALGRPPRDFNDFVRDAAATGVWDRPPARVGAG